MERNEGQEAQKRKMLLSHILYPKLDANYLRCISSVDKKTTMNSKYGWMTWKEVTDKFGNEEACEMHEDGRFNTRPNPQNPKRAQYCVRSDELNVSITQARTTMYTKSSPKRKNRKNNMGGTGG